MPPPEQPESWSSSGPRILGVGLACLDYLFLSPRVRPGRQAAPLRAHLVQGGGVVGTAVVAAARLGAVAELWSWVGDDTEGRHVIAELKEEEVDARAVRAVPGARTPVSFVHVEEESGERTIFHGPYLPLPSAEPAALAARPLACDALVLDAYWPEASLSAARRAGEAGVPVVGDLCPDSRLAELTGLVTALIAPQLCAERLLPGASWEERLRALAGLGPSFVAITVGGEGCYYLDRGESAHQPSFSVPVTDTTGAGDVFHGAFAYALARKWPAPRAVELASAAAALSCRALGGRTAIPDLQETLSFLRERGSHWWSGTP